MEMTRACWNIPDTFSTSSLPLWITGVSAYQNVLLWGQLPSTFITVSMILWVPVSGERRCFRPLCLKAQRCNNRAAALFKDVIECVFPVKWEPFFGGFLHLKLKVLRFMGWPAGGGRFSWTCSPLQPPHPSPSSACLMLPLMRGVPAQTSFHSTEGEHMLEALQRESSRALTLDFFSGSWITSLKPGSSCLQSTWT